ncbi:NAD-dependent malic enzyme, partial [Acinetobacter baumannii]
DYTIGEEWIETSLAGKLLLTTPQLNKGTAFTLEERISFGLLGKLPVTVETLEQQVLRAYEQFQSYKNTLNRNIYLNELHDSNQI